MNWQALRNLTHVQVGAFLALMLVAMQPFFGPRLPSLLLLGMGVWLAWKERAALFVTPAMRRWLIVFLLLFVPVLISVPGSFDVRTSANVAGALVLFFFAGVAIVRAMRGEAERLWLAKWITIVLALWVVDGGIQYLFGKDVFLVPVTPDGRIIGPFEGNLRMSILLALLLPAALWVVLRRSAMGAILAFLATSGMAMLSGVRTVVVFLGIVAGGFYLRLPRRRRKFPAFLALAAVLSLAVVLSPALEGRLHLVTELHTLNFESIDRVTSYRLTIWDTASNMVLDRPLAGVGAGAFAHAYTHYSTRPGDVFADGKAEVFHAHQLYIGAAAETGLPGLIGLVAIFALCVKWYFSASPARRDRAWPFMLGLLAYAFPFTTQPVLFSLWLFPVVLLLLTGMLAALDEPPTGTGTTQQV